MIDKKCIIETEQQAFELLKDMYTDLIRLEYFFEKHKAFRLAIHCFEINSLAEISINKLQKEIQNSRQEKTFKEIKQAMKEKVSYYFDEDYEND